MAVSASLAGSLQAAQTNDSDELLVVSCLLPGQIRQLGSRTTYVSARRPTKTTALECRILGGEYVVSDRATLKTALDVWLDAAETGSREAQVTLGEVFEQGLGVPPDYAAARYWYEKAADQGSSRALVNLGNLYERGLGVTSDAQRALNYYRAASGLPATTTETVTLDTSNDVAPVSSALQDDVNRLEQALSVMQAETNALSQALEDSRSALASVLQVSAEQAVQAAETDRLHLERLQQQVTQLNQYESELIERNARIRALQSTVNELQADSRKAYDLTEELQELQAVMGQQQAEFVALQANLYATTEERDNLQQLVQLNQKNLAASEETSKAQLQEIQRLVERMQQLEMAASRRNTAIDPMDPSVAGPSLTIIEPQLSTTRGLKVKLPARASNATTQIIGRVVAPAGILSVLLNGEAMELNNAGVFVYQLETRSTDTEVQITAIDQQGRRAEQQFSLVTREAPSPVPDKPTLKLGRYHALLIGNSDYTWLPKLETPLNDVQRLQEILESRYGFDVTVLREGTRYQILSALNDLRARLTNDDNLLIYYAGHGELDRANMRGHWLPIDAEPTSTANWISNVAVTDILNVINARQIMLVVDSCYSGTLTRSSLANLNAAMNETERAEWLNMLSQKKARVVLTSGGLAPVLDVGGGSHSVFASAFLDVLERNTELLTGRAFYDAVAARVAFAASNMEFEQIPSFAPIARSGHEAGDFVLRPLSP